MRVLSERIRGMGKRRIIIFVVIILFCIAAVWIFFRFKKPTKLNDIAYDVNKRHGYTVYIEEKAGYAPYLVLTNDYEGDGNVLLLRRQTLAEYQPFNKETEREPYYEDSYIDGYLNTVYFEMLDADVQDQVLDSYIKIQDYSIWTGGGPRGEPDTKIIRRKAFLLSFAEVLPGSLGNFPVDGEPIKYFTDDMNRILATDMNNELTVWMLRSGSMGESSVNMVIPREVRSGNVDMYSPTSVRPAFCLDRNTKIIEDSTIDKGEKVYVLKKE